MQVLPLKTQNNYHHLSIVIKHIISTTRPRPTALVVITIIIWGVVAQ